MAITGTKAFTSGEVLTANDVNQYLMRGVKVFSSTAVRDAAYGGAGEPVLEEGETCFLADSDALQVYGGTAAGWLSYPTTTQSGKVLQVVSTTKLDTFSLTSTTFTDITGLSATITPTSTSSKVLIMVGCIVQTGTGNPLLRLVRGSTNICLGTAAGSNRQQASAGLYGADGRNLSFHFLDSPSTTSATTYKLQLRAQNSAAAAVAVSIGTTGDDADRTDNARTTNSITLMEIGA